MGAEEYLTWDQICEKYPNEWVFLDKITAKRRASEVVTGGVVVLHTADRPEFIRRVFDFPQVKHGAILYTGPPLLDDEEEVIEV